MAPETNLPIRARGIRALSRAKTRMRSPRSPLGKTQRTKAECSLARAMPAGPQTAARRSRTGNRGASTTNRIAQGQHNQRNAQSRTTQSGNGQFANQQRNRTQRSTSTAQRNEQLKGLQGSTRAPMQGATSTEQGGGGANVSLNDQQRTQIRESIINSSNAPRVRNPNLSVNIGTVVPRGQIHLVRVPPTLVQIRPGWRNFLYFVYNDRIVIV